MYDVVIVGGGIAGLYRAYTTVSSRPTSSPPPQILVLESSGRWGGRICTVHAPPSLDMEYGAGRFHRGHRRLLALLDAMGLKHRIQPSTGQTGLDERTYRCLATVFQHAQKAPPDTLATMSWVEYVRRHPSLLSPEDQDHVLGHFGYSSELRHMNMVDATALIRDMVGTSARRAPTFYTLQGGLNQLVDRLVAYLQQHGVEMILDAQVTSVQTTDGVGFNVQRRGATKPYEAREVVLAVPKESLLRFALLRPIRPLLATVFTAALCRLYAVFDPDPTTGKPWFAGMKKQAVDSPLRWFIPINESTGLAMASYTDDRYAHHWHRIWQEGGIRAVKTHLREELRKVFQVHVPTPKKVYMAYWPSGVGYWRPRTGKLARQTTREIAERIARPLGNDVPLYVVGENYSWSHQQWIEGALSQETK